MKRTASDAAIIRKTPKAKRQLTYPPNVDMIVERKVKRALDKKTDWRITDVSVVNAALSTGGLIYDLQSNLSRGDADFNNFEGNTIFPKWLEIRWDIRNQATVAVADTFRIIVGQQIGGASIPTVANLMQVQTPGIAALSAFNNDFKQAFRILHDQVVNVDNYENGVISNVKNDKIFIPGWKIRQIDFNAGSAVPIRGGLFYCVIANNTPVTASCTHAFYGRIKFST